MPDLNSCADLESGVHNGVKYHVNRAIPDGSVYDYECAHGYIPDGTQTAGVVQCTEDHYNLIFTDYAMGYDVTQPKCKFNIAIGIGYGLAGLLLILTVIFLTLCIRYRRRLSDIYGNLPLRRRRLSVPTIPLDKQEMDERYPRMPQSAAAAQAPNLQPSSGFLPISEPSRSSMDTSHVDRTSSRRPTPCPRVSRPPTEVYMTPAHIIRQADQRSNFDDRASEAASSVTYGSAGETNLHGHSYFNSGTAEIFRKHIDLTHLGASTSDPVTGTNVDDRGYAQPNVHTNPSFSNEDRMSKCSSFATLDLDDYPSLANDLETNWEKQQHPQYLQGQPEQASQVRLTEEAIREHNSNTRVRGPRMPNTSTRVYDQVPNEEEYNKRQSLGSMVLHI